MRNIVEISSPEQEKIIKRLYENGFVPNTFITFNPGQTNISEQKLAYHFKEGLGKYYSKTLGKRYNKHPEKQYKMIVFLEHGKNRDIDESTPHLHILIDLPKDKVQDFYEFMLNHLTLYYYYISDVRDKTLIDITGQPLDMKQLWCYGDKEFVKSEKGRRFRPSRIFTTKDFQKPIRHFNQYNKHECIREWFLSAP